jgi:hypothetical protein
MTKKPSLTAALQAASGKSTPPPPVIAAAIAAPPPELSAKTEVLSRVGKKMVSGHFDPAVGRQLKQLALDRDTTVQNLIAEALNDLFAKHGKQRIA